ncbi:MAG: hypothetical protein H6636_12975 [Anaerolineales bacterium]|nr:hypothetical protein [Anaerolineales bacterium]
MFSFLPFTLSPFHLFSFASARGLYSAQPGTFAHNHTDANARTYVDSDARAYPFADACCYCHFCTNDCTNKNADSADRNCASCISELVHQTYQYC